MALWETLGVGFALGNERGGTIGVCPRYADILGLSVDQAIGLRMEDVTHPDDIRVNRWLLDNAATAPGGFVVRKRYVKADGSIQWVENRVISFGQTRTLPTYLLACLPLREPTRLLLEEPPSMENIDYVTDMAGQLAVLADEVRLHDAAHLLRMAVESAKV